VQARLPLTQPRRVASLATTPRGHCLSSVVTGRAGVQWHDARRAAPSLDQTVRGVAPRLFAPLVVSQGCTVTSRLCMSLAAGYRALSSSIRCKECAYTEEASAAFEGGGTLTAGKSRRRVPTTAPKLRHVEDCAAVNTAFDVIETDVGVGPQAVVESHTFVEEAPATLEQLRAA
jgi:hypothetical protein